MQHESFSASFGRSLEELIKLLQLKISRRFPANSTKSKETNPKIHILRTLEDSIRSDKGPESIKQQHYRRQRFAGLPLTVATLARLN